MKEPKIDVGLYTDGDPILKKEGALTRVDNLIIGHGFHWQQRLSILVEGELTPAETGEEDIHIINSLPLERYIASVIGSEMNPAAPLEFQKAHAVISRGWAMVTMQKHEAHQAFDVCSDDHCQRYQGVTLQNEEAVRSTRGLVLVDKDGNIADTRYSKCCGGKTELFSTCWEDYDPHYLVSKDDPWCDLSGMSSEERDTFMRTAFKTYDSSTDFYHWHAETDTETVKNRLKERFGYELQEVSEIIPIHRGPSGRLDKIEIRGIGNESVTLGKELAIRRLLADTHLFSSAFHIRKAGNRFLIEGRGWGHGVGLCQIGAANMARVGHTFKEILEFYYPGTQLKKFYD